MIVYFFQNWNNANIYLVKYNMQDQLEICRDKNSERITLKDILKNDDNYICYLEEINPIDKTQSILIGIGWVIN